MREWHEPNYLATNSSNSEATNKTMDVNTYRSDCLLVALKRRGLPDPPCPVDELPVAPRVFGFVVPLSTSRATRAGLGTSSPASQWPAASWACQLLLISTPVLPAGLDASVV
jgi:hypothetical protein